VQIVGYINTNKDHLHGQKWNSIGNLNFLVPSGPVQACNGTALPHQNICKWRIFAIVSEVDMAEILKESKSTHSSEYSSDSRDEPEIQMKLRLWCVRICATEFVYIVQYCYISSTVSFSIKYRVFQELRSLLRDLISRADAQSNSSYTHGPSSQRFRSYELLKSIYLSGFF